MSCRKVLLNKPIPGDFLENPTTSFGILSQRNCDTTKRKVVFSHLSIKNFLQFFFQRKDPFSEKVAEIVNMFASLNGWIIKEVSLDGKGVSSLLEFEVDKGISQNIGVEATPSFLW